MKCIAIAISLAFLFPVQMAGAADEEQARQDIYGGAQKVLIDHGVCASPAECSNSKVLFFSRKKAGIHVEAFGVQRPEVVAALVLFVMREYEARGRDFAIDFHFYAQPHHELMGVKKAYTKPFIEIELTGEGQ